MTKTGSGSNPINSFTSQLVSIDPFVNNQTAVFQINVPANLGVGTKVIFQYTGAGGTSDKTARWAFVSQTPCTSTNDTSTKASVVYGSPSGNINAVIDTTNQLTGAYTATPVIHMTPGSTWYIMFQNWQNLSKPTGTSCTSSDCPLTLSPGIGN